MAAINDLSFALEAGGVPAPVLAMRVAPNPFNPRTAIRFELTTPGSAELRVHDLAGRLVMTLVDGRELAAGTHRSVWDGKDHAGRTVAAGVYIARLTAGGDIRSTRLTLIK